jgi:outer membrane protein OmpA-like peptidoglycan-associated protein/tetratricopeptide (TPR) repeat protein
MKRLKPILFLSFILLSFFSYAQEYSTKNKKAIKDFVEADGLLHNRKFPEAIQLLEGALTKDPAFLEARLKLASAYKSMGDDVHAKPHYLKAAELKPDAKEYYKLYYTVGEYYLNDGDYDNAKKYFDKIVEYNPNDKLVMYKTNMLLVNCNFAIEAKKHPLKFNPFVMDSKINKYFIHAFPRLTADQQTFIYSKRDGPRLEQDEDIVMSKKVNGEWTDPVSISKNINTPYNEGAPSLSADGKVLVLVSCNTKTTLGACDLYISYKKGEDWTVPVNMGPNVNSNVWDSEPAISADGKTIYFSSERSGGIGLFDLYMTTLDDNGNWTKAKNLGRPINTEGKEVSPFIHANSTTLYFSSDKHPGMGGYDIFYSHKLDSAGWSKPVNVGYPLNTQLNDAQIFITADSKKGFYEVYERKDMRYNKALLYEFEVPQELKEEMVSSYAKGTVYDSETKQKLGAKVELIDLKKQRVIQSVKSDSINGDYMIVVTRGTEYGLYVSKEGYLFKSVFFEDKDPKSTEPLSLDVYLDPVKAGKAVVLNNIFFPTNSFTLEEKSQTELDKIILFLRQNPKVIIEFGGHTDDVGSDKDNMDLSLKRAKSVYDYIAKKGIPAVRMKFKGYGETKPVVPNVNEVNRRMNRRIEFKVL